MNLSDAPKKQPVPFGVNGQREELLATTPAGNQQASYDVGFPAITMLLKSAGGLPPKGQDFNQIFYELASIARWAGAGGNYLFDSAFSTAVSGYPVGATVLSSDGAGFWLNGTNGNTTNPEAADSTLTGWVPVDHVGSTVITGLSASNVKLSSLQAAKDVITLAGTLTANINIILPAWKKKWKIVNNCTGSFTVTVKTFSGTGQTIPSGQEANIRCDGTNISYAELNTKSLFSEISTLGSTSISQALANLRLGAGAPPIGIPFFWPSAAMPNTVMDEWSDMVFLKFNGATFSASTYPKLALVIPSLTLPDARGEFPRIWDDGRGVDAGRAIFSAQGDAIRNIVGSINALGAESGAFYYSRTPPTGSWVHWSADTATHDVMTYGFDASRVVPTASENRPRNIAFNFLVRAK